MNLKKILFICGGIGLLILIWPLVKFAIRSYIYSLVLEYGFYFLIALAGGGYYLWKRIKA